MHTKHFFGYCCCALHFFFFSLCLCINATSQNIREIKWIGTECRCWCRCCLLLQTDDNAINMQNIVMLEDNDSSDNIAATDEEDMTRVLSEKEKIWWRREMYEFIMMQMNCMTCQTSLPHSLPFLSHRTKVHFKVNERERIRCDEKAWDAVETEKHVDCITNADQTHSSIVIAAKRKATERTEKKNHPT